MCSHLIPLFTDSNTIRALAGRGSLGTLLDLLKECDPAGSFSATRGRLKVSPNTEGMDVDLLFDATDKPPNELLRYTGVPARPGLSRRRDMILLLLLLKRRC